MELTNEQIEQLRSLLKVIGDVGGIGSQVNSAEVIVIDCAKATACVENIGLVPDDNPLLQVWRNLGDAWQALYHAEIKLKQFLETTTK